MNLPFLCDEYLSTHISNHSIALFLFWRLFQKQTNSHYFSLFKQNYLSSSLLLTLYLEHHSSYSYLFTHCDFLQTSFMLLQIIFQRAPWQRRLFELEIILMCYLPLISYFLTRIYQSQNWLSKQLNQQLCLEFLMKINC